MTQENVAGCVHVDLSEAAALTSVLLKQTGDKLIASKAPLCKMQDNLIAIIVDIVRYEDGSKATWHFHFFPLRKFVVCGAYFLFHQ